VRMVALTGYGQPDDHRNSLEAGFDHHVTKPVDYDILQQLLILEPDPGTPRQRLARAAD